jgi:hypothetical protein
MWKQIGGVAAAILTGVLTWWLTEGLREREIPVTPGSSPATVALTQQQPPGVGACASGASPDRAFHNAAAANGSWDWDCNGTVERQWAACENLSRAQCDPNTNQTGAPPGFCSEIRSPGGCTPQIAACGQSGWVYPCFYNAADGRCHAGGLETAVTMACR